jgi:hypothetical protein
MKLFCCKEAKYGSGRGYLTLFREATERGLKVTELWERLTAPDSRLKRIRYREAEEGAKAYAS